MSLTLRSVLYAKRVNISNVPVYTCERCSRNEVFPGVKSDLGVLVGRLGSQPHAQTIPFDEIHEWAGVLSHAQSHSKPLRPAMVARVTEERTNELLDLWLVASSVGDEAWMAELRERLSQLSAQYIS
ncbi:hypothetical protein [Cohnella nanjingensis]|uniref:Uncharacterized protein n=1 Tax=Cohnella nanjingensis TaxID=1387779 RepID=A0A7X0RRU6_9BACL|nr:hypothetical protein [Cohnella nanjingensis]MBB6671119.1 hypothetical protein [Cohnella nanjingensis]